MSTPEILIDNPFYYLNLTVLLSVITVSLAAMGTLTVIFKKKTKSKELPNDYDLQKENIDRIENTTKENAEKHEALREIVNKLEKEVGILQNESENMSKNMDEVKQSNKEIANRLDELLKQLLDWMSE